MTRLLVQVQELPARNGIGRIELTWRQSRTRGVTIQTSTGTYQHAGVGDFTSTEILTYQDQAERAQLLRTYTPDAVGETP